MPLIKTIKTFLCYGAEWSACRGWIRSSGASQQIPKARQHPQAIRQTESVR
jgi:hypothetical protein